MNTTISSNSLSALPQTKTNPGTSGSQDTSVSSNGSPSRPADDSVQLTDSAIALQQASGANAQSPVNTARVEQLRNAIANGSYSINPSQIADRMTALESQINRTP
jgi:negative regulator of flagellin synthesis FlgM